MQSKPTAGIVIIGNEILSGRTQDTNIQFIAKRLLTLGITLEYTAIIPDNHDAIIKTVNSLREKYTYVFTTGGIGPTHDDITAKAIAAAFKLPFEKHPEAYKILLDFYGEKEFTEARQKMAYMPKNATLLHNSVTAAPAFQVENVYVLAGFPKIMQKMFLWVEAYLKGSASILSEAVHCYMAESIIAKGLENIQGKYKNLEIGSYPFYENKNTHGTTLVVKGVNTANIAQAIEEIVRLIKDNNGTPLKGEAPKNP